jgi:hypothetical protein
VIDAYILLLLIFSEADALYTSARAKDGDSETAKRGDRLMKAALLYSYGDPEQLRYEETAMPKYGDDEVLVR